MQIRQKYALRQKVYFVGKEGDLLINIQSGEIKEINSKVIESGRPFHKYFLGDSRYTSEPFYEAELFSSEKEAFLAAKENKIKKLTSLIEHNMEELALSKKNLKEVKKL